MMPPKVSFEDIYEEALRRAMRPRYPGRVRPGTPESEIEYSSSDGRMMAETPLHRDTVIYCIRSVERALKDRADAYVSGNNFIYYERGDPRKRVTPDCYVVFGAKPKLKYERESFKVWEEQDRLPSFVLEVTSKYTRPEDEQLKRPLYERWGVEEYFYFDPWGDYLHPTLQGNRLVDGKYLPIEIINGRLHSRVLNFNFYDEGKNLRIVDMRDAEVVLTFEEQMKLTALHQQRANVAEQEIAHLRVALEAARAGQGSGIHD